MPKCRMADGWETRSWPTPCGIIRVTALCDLCRYRHNGHWSGGASRLARTFGKRFGDNAYSFEELVAEIGSGLICAHLGLPNELHDSHASYVGHWLSILKGDKTAIIHAASKAEQAFNYLLSFSEEADVEQSDGSTRDVVGTLAHAA
jgi:antirestriction protein ArdC